MFLKKKKPQGVPEPNNRTIVDSEGRAWIKYLGIDGYYHLRLDGGGRSTGYVKLHTSAWGDIEAYPSSIIMNEANDVLSFHPYGSFSY